MDKERRKKIQTTKLVITEIFMLIIIVLTVVILTFVVMGYHLNEDGKLEQSGLVQVESTPDGAAVIIDGEVLPSKTDTNKILKEGEHTVKIEKPGYTSWQKTVSSRPGFLTKLSYPRLYKTDRKAESVYTFETTPDTFLVSPNRDTILTADNNSLKLQLINIHSNSVKPVEVDLSKLLVDSTGEKTILEWNKDNSRIILKFTKNDTPHFAVVDLEHPSLSIDLTTSFDIQISALHFRNDSGDQLFILENNHLRTISIADKQISGILVEDVKTFSNLSEKVLLVTKTNQLSLYDAGDKSTLPLFTSTAENIRPIISEYIGRTTTALSEDNNVTIYRGDLPTEKTLDKEKPLGEPVGKYTLEFGTPQDFFMQAKNQIIVSKKDKNLSVFDLENYQVSTFALPTSLTFWPDEYTIGLVSDGTLSVYDFDGTNRIDLGEAESGFPATISKDNNYLYLVRKTDKLELIRENIK